jgi:hypothetical protein
MAIYVTMLVMVRPKSHSPVPVFQEQVGVAILVGWICLQCGIEQAPSQIAPARDPTYPRDFLANGYSKARGAKA